MLFKFYAIFSNFLFVIFSIDNNFFSFFLFILVFCLFLTRVRNLWKHNFFLLLITWTSSSATFHSSFKYLSLWKKQRKRSLNNSNIALVSSLATVYFCICLSVCLASSHHQLRNEWRPLLESSSSSRVKKKVKQLSGSCFCCFCQITTNKKLSHLYDVSVVMLVFDFFFFCQ